MTKLAKLAIKRAFLDLLQEKPLGHITVTEITARCHLNRNTFYYHYHDTSALVEDILLEQTDQILAQYPTLGSIEDCLYAILDFVHDNRRSVIHIYQSLSRSVCEKYLWKVCRRLVTNYWKDSPARNNLTPEEAEVILNFHICTCFGLAMDWLVRGADEKTARKHIRVLGKNVKMLKI